MNNQSRIFSETVVAERLDPAGIAPGRNQIVVASGAGARFESEVVEEVIQVLRAGDVVLVQCEIPATIVESVLRAVETTAALCVLNLAPAEHATLQSLSAEGNIRLEQERIPWRYALARLGVL